MNTVGTFMGMTVVEDVRLVDYHKEVIMCRSKKRRIRKKWVKNPSHWKEWHTPKQELCVVGGVMFGHPATVQQMKGILRR